MRWMVGFVALAAAAPALAAEPAPAGPAHDVRCFLALSTLADSKVASEHQTGILGAMYFAGKLFGANPNIDLTAALKAEAATVTEADMAQAFPACGDEMATRGGQMQAASAALAAKGKTGN